MADVQAALRSAIAHIEHMAAWIAARKAGYSFESLGEDMPGIKGAHAQLDSADAAKPVAWQWRYAGSDEWNTPSGGKQLTQSQLKNERPIEQRPLYAALPDASPGAEKLGRFGHHPDPAIDFCIEVECIENEWSNIKAGFTNGTPSRKEIEDRVFRAMQFRVGGDTGAVDAKAVLRKVEAEMRADASPGNGAVASSVVSKIEEARDLFWNIKGDFSDPRTECRRGADLLEEVLAALHSTSAAGETGPALNEAEIRAGLNILLETIAAKFETWNTLDIWRSEAASTVRSYKRSTQGGPTVKDPDRPTCKPDGSCCDFTCGN